MTIGNLTVPSQAIGESQLVFCFALVLQRTPCADIAGTSSAGLFLGIASIMPFFTSLVLGRLLAHQRLYCGLINRNAAAGDRSLCSERRRSAPAFVYCRDVKLQWFSMDANDS